MIKLIVVAGLASAAPGVVCAQAQPTISSFTPTSGPVSTVVTVTGSGFTGATAAWIGSAHDAAFTVVSDTSIKITIPSDAAVGSDQIAVLNASHSGFSSSDFSVTSGSAPQPTISSFSPTSGPVATAVTVTGSGFTGATAVWIGAAHDAAFSVVSDTSINITIPSDAAVGSDQIAVLNASHSGFSGSDFTVTGADTTPPTAPSALTPTVASSSQINLSWSASTDNVGVTGYRVERCSGASCTNFAQISAPTGTSYSDTGLTASTSYSYRVRASDAAGNLSAYSGTASATTTAGTAPQPNITSFSPTSGPVGTAVTVTGSGFTGATAAWIGSAHDAAFTVASDTTINITIPSDAAVGSDQIAVLNPSHSGFSSSDFVVTGADTTPPTAPTGLTPAVISSTQINLNWTASTDNVGVTGYLIQSCQGASCSSFAQIASVGGAVTSYNNTGLASSTSYSYRVQATDAAGNLSTYSSVASATTGAGGDTQPPSNPTNLTATAGPMDTVLVWTASTDNVGVTGYFVERCQGVSCTSFTQIGTVAGTVTTYTDSGITADANYSYRVRATDAAGNLSGYSNTTADTPLDCD